jgi:Zn-dependent protease
MSVSLLPIADLGSKLDPNVVIPIITVLFVGIGLHEYSHAKFADLSGDPTPRYYGRVTLNLFKHLDPIGSIMMVITALSGYGLGWGKPCPVNPAKMRNPRWDHFLTVLAGPLSNILQAIAYAVMFRILFAMRAPILRSELADNFLLLGVEVNLTLAFFNLIPLGPLDGMWVLGTFLPERQRYAWTKFNLSIGQFLFLGLVLLGQGTGFSPLWSVLEPPINFGMSILLPHLSQA